MAALDEGQRKAAKELLLFRNIINETVGDAISDMLAVQAILGAMNWTPEDWFSEYEDLPNRLLKVTVRDRTMVETMPDDESICVKPPGLQQEIDRLVAAA